MIKRGLLALCCAAVALVVLAPAAYAQVTNDEEFYEARGFKDKFKLAGGGFILRASTNAGLTVGGEPLPEPEIDLEDVLDLSRTSTNLFISGHYRFSRKHKVTYGYTFWSRSATAEIPEDDPIEWDDLEFSGSITSGFDANIVGLGYTYSFIANEKVSLGAGIQVNTWFNTIELDGQARIADPGAGQDTTLMSENRRGDIAFPVPLILGSFDYVIKPGMMITASAGYLGASFGDFSASAYGINGSWDYYPWKNFGFALGWSFLGLSYEETSDEEALNVNYDVNGLTFQVVLID